MHIGLKPDEVLDMSLDIFEACVQGYSDRVVDQRVLNVDLAYWTGYYTRASKVKPPSEIQRQITRAVSPRAVKADPDIETFKRREARFKEALAKGGDVRVRRF